MKQKLKPRPVYLVRTEVMDFRSLLFPKAEEECRGGYLILPFSHFNLLVIPHSHIQPETIVSGALEI
jgi:hypothetical protein